MKFFALIILWTVCGFIFAPIPTSSLSRWAYGLPPKVTPAEIRKNRHRALIMTMIVFGSTMIALVIE